MWWWDDRVDVVVFFKHKTAYEMRISDWSSDVCSSDLGGRAAARWAPDLRATRSVRGSGRECACGNGWIEEAPSPASPDAAKRRSGVQVWRWFAAPLGWRGGVMGPGSPRCALRPGKR